MAETQRSAGNAKVVGLAAAGAVGGFLFGFDSSVVNGAVNAIASQFHLEIGGFLIGFAIASALLGCAVGAYIAGRIADRWGRIPAMVIGAVLFLVSSLGSGLAFGVWDLVFWRLIGGLGIGLASVIAPAYIAEISPAKIRGRLASLQQLAIVTGIFAALLSDAFFGITAGGAAEQFWFGLEAWRWMFLVCAIPAVVYGLIAFALPESPRFLALKGRDQAARSVLERIGGVDNADAAIKSIHDEIARDKANAASGTLRGHALGLKPIVWIGILLSIFQQFVGINVIFYYSTTLWRSVGFDEGSSLIISVASSITNIVVTIVAIALIDHVGRKPLLLVGSAGMTVSLATMALAFSQATIVGGAPQLDGAWGPIALVAANLFVIFFGVSWGPVVWVLLGEIFPNKIRARALGVAAGAQWIANFVITLSFPKLAEFSLPFTYGLYALFALVSFFFVARFIRETKGVSLEISGHMTTEREARS